MTVHTTDCTPLSVCRYWPEIMINARFGAISALHSGMLASSTFNVCIKHTVSRLRVLNLQRHQRNRWGYHTSNERGGPWLSHEVWFCCKRSLSYSTGLLCVLLGSTRLPYHIWKGTYIASMWLPDPLISIVKKAWNLTCKPLNVWHLLYFTLSLCHFSTESNFLGTIWKLTY